MSERESKRQLSGQVEIDDAYLAVSGRASQANEAVHQPGIPSFDE